MEPRVFTNGNQLYNACRGENLTPVAYTRLGHIVLRLLGERDAVLLNAITMDNVDGRGILVEMDGNVGVAVVAYDISDVPFGPDNCDITKLTPKYDWRDRSS